MFGIWTAYSETLRIFEDSEPSVSCGNSKSCFFLIGIWERSLNNCHCRNEEMGFSGIFWNLWEFQGTLVSFEIKKEKNLRKFLFSS